MARTRRSFAPCARATLSGEADRRAKLAVEKIELHRLDEVCRAARAKARGHALRCALPREEDHRDSGRRVELADALDHCDTVHPGHGHVGNDDVGRLVRRTLQALCPVPGGHDLVAFGEPAGHRLARDVVVLDEEHARESAPCFDPGRPGRLDFRRLRSAPRELLDVGDETGGFLYGLRLERPRLARMPIAFELVDERSDDRGLRLHGAHIVVRVVHRASLAEQAAVHSPPGRHVALCGTRSVLEVGRMRRGAAFARRLTCCRRHRSDSRFLPRWRQARRRGG
jgi:hypothetical protein